MSYGSALQARASTENSSIAGFVFGLRMGQERRINCIHLKWSKECYETRDVPPFADGDRSPSQAGPGRSIQCAGGLWQERRLGGGVLSIRVLRISPLAEAQKFPKNLGALRNNLNLIGGLEHQCDFSIYWEFHHPN